MQQAPFALLALLAASLLVACGSTSARGDAAGAGGLAGTAWTCTRIEGRAVHGPELTLEVDDDGKVGGHTGLNRWFGGEVRGDGSLVLDPLGMTRMAGPEELMDQESRYVKALGRCSGFRRDGDRLVLLDGETVVLTFADQH